MNILRTLSSGKFIGALVGLSLTLAAVTSRALDPLETLFVSATLEGEIQDVTAEKAGGTVARMPGAPTEYQVWAGIFKLADGSKVLAERTYLVPTGAAPRSGTALSPLGLLDVPGGQLVHSTAMVLGDLSVQYASHPFTEQQIKIEGVELYKENEAGWFKGKSTPATPKDFYLKMNTLRASRPAPDHVHGNYLFTQADTKVSDEVAEPRTADCDPLQWHLAMINAQSAWSFYGKDSTRITTIFDIGIQKATAHPDLGTNADFNDGKSFIAGATLEDPHGHGTRMAGVLGAKGANGKGGCGICWTIKMAPYVVMQKDLNGNPVATSDAVATAADYLFDHHNTGTGLPRVPVALHGYGMPDYVPKMFGAITRAQADNSPVPMDNQVLAWWDDKSRNLKLKGNQLEIDKVLPGMPVSSTGNLNPNTVVLRVYKDNMQRTVIILSGLPAISAIAEADAKPLRFLARLRAIPYGTLHVAPAGSPDIIDGDENPRFPGAFPSAYMVNVGGSDTGIDNAGNNVGEKPSGFYGKRTVDLFAPGVKIYTTNKGSTYNLYDGSEYSAAQVAGALALYYEKNIAQPPTPQQMRDALMARGFDAVPTLQDKCVSGGRLNILKLLTPVTR